MINRIEEVWYEARDGSRWKTDSEAKYREETLDRVDEAMKEMPPVVDKTTDFANGGGYRTWPREVVERTRGMVLALVQEWFERKAAGEYAEFWKRYLPIQLPRRSVMIAMQENDCLLYGIAHRVFYDIDTQYREWGQRYYAEHPHEGKQVEWPL